jgi:excisionase family DNA binding protein
MESHAPLGERITVRPREVGSLTGLGPSKVKRLIRSGEIRSFRHGKDRLVPVCAIREWVESNTYPAQEHNKDVEFVDGAAEKFS